MTIFEVLLWSVNMTGWVISASSEMSAYGPLTPNGGRHGAPFGRELLVYLRQILHRNISLRGQDLLDRTGDPSPRD